MRLMTSTLKTCIAILLVQGVFSAQNDTKDIGIAQIWGYGLLTGIGVSLLGFLAAMLLVSIKNCFTDETFTFIINTFYSLGCGAIIGDAMIHILPDAFSKSAANPQLVSLTFILAILFFLLLERVFQHYGISHQHWEEDEHNHRQQKNSNAIEPLTANQEPIGSIPLEVNNSQSLQLQPQPKEQNSTLNLSSNENIQIEPKAKQSKETVTCWENLKGKGAAGYLNLLSSFIHNFMDGFGIGVGFASGSRAVYLPIVIAIFAHEIPREMGDVAILMKNRFSGIQTVLCNGFINLMSLLGVIIGLALGNISDTVNTYILVIVAGNFIYIGAEIWRHLFKNKTLLKNLVELIGLSIGVGAMFLVLLAEAS